MNGSEISKAKEIFGEALDLHGQARTVYLDRACAGDAPLRKRINALLEAAQRPDVFLKEPTIASAGEDRFEKAGSRIGPYRLLELIGEGGFGSVFVAEQTVPVHRRAALKVIKLGMDTRQVIARFEAERQALAMMDHPHIARVLDGGATEGGRPYFVMELVKGEQITKYCDKQNLTVSERLELFMQVCHAVQHAHQKGVIHRDIKPSNILVSTQDGRPFAKVIDFGIAKATASRLTEKTLFTEHRAMIGTPEYMSPEQAEGGLDVDTRTDVYSLGVLLYELLTASTPFRGEDLRSAAYGEIQRIIREVEPDKPSTRLSHSKDTLLNVATHRRIEPRRLGGLIRGELDWIVMKALEKDRARRYDTPGAMAADVRRHLDGEAVSAGPPSRTYLLRKVVARNRGPVLAGALIIAALFVGAIGTAIFAVAEAKARKRAESAEASTRLRAAELERVAGFQEAQLRAVHPEQMADALRRELVSQVHASMSAAKLPESEIEAQIGSLQSLLARANLTGVAVHLLDVSILDRSVKAIETQFNDQPLVRARLLQGVADTLSTLGLFDRAAAPQAQALAIRRKHLGEDHADTIASISASAEVFRGQGRQDLAGPLYEEAFQTARRALERDHPAALAALVSLGALRFTQGKLDEAEPLQREAIETSRRVLGESHPETAGAMSNLAFTLGRRNRFDEAVKLMEAALDMRRRALGDANPDTMESWNHLGFMLVDAGRAPEAERIFRDGYEILRKLLGDDHPATLKSLNNIGSALRAQGKAVDAERIFRQAWEKRQRLLGPDHTDTVDALANLSVAVADLERNEEALALYREAYERRLRMLGPDDPKTLNSMSNMGSILESLNQLDQAEPYVRGAFESRRRILGPDALETLVSENNYGYFLHRRGLLDQAEPLLREVLEKRRSTAGPTNPRTLTSMHLLAGLLRDRGRLNEAAALFKEALDGRIARLTDKHPHVADSRYWYAKTLVQQGKFAAAEPNALAAAEYLQTQPSPVSRLKRSQELLVDLYTQWNTAEPGKGYDEKAAQWQKRIASP